MPRLPTSNEGRCCEAPRLPRETEVHVSKRHTCHAKRRLMSPSATPAAQSAAASPLDQGAPSTPPEPAQCHKCHACHVKRRLMSPSASPATETEIHVSKCHACHTKRRSMSPSATPAMQNESSCEQVPQVARRPATKRATRASQVQQVPRLQRQTQVDVTKCHACHLNGTSMSRSATLATQSGAAPRSTNGDQACHQSQPSATSAMLTTRNENRCRQVPRLPRKTKVHVSKCHACHAKWRSVPGD